MLVDTLIVLHCRPCGCLEWEGRCIVQRERVRNMKRLSMGLRAFHGDNCCAWHEGEGDVRVIGVGRHFGGAFDCVGTLEVCRSEATPRASMRPAVVR